jgi:hypothetical protein
MKMIPTIIVLLLSAVATAEEQPDAAPAHSKAMTHSDFVFVCKVVDEGPLGHGSNTVQKSYKVSYPESLHFGLIGLDLPGEIWIHYDSSRYPKVPKSGFESTFHKGDSFIAFVDHVEKGDFAFQIVRLDKIDEEEEIKTLIKEHLTVKPEPPIKKITPVLTVPTSGSKTTFRFIVRNEGGKPATVDGPFANQTRLIVQFPDGKTKEVFNWKEGRTPEPLQPGKSVQWDVDITNHFEMKDSGLYRTSFSVNGTESNQIIVVKD